MKTFITHSSSTVIASGHYNSSHTTHSVFVTSYLRVVGRLAVCCLKTIDLKRFLMAILLFAQSVCLYTSAWNVNSGVLNNNVYNSY